MQAPFLDVELLEENEFASEVLLGEGGDSDCRIDAKDDGEKVVAGLGGALIDCWSFL
jgi:hypothetical protein